MQVIVSQNDFINAIGAVLGVVDRRGTMPILAHVLLQANGDGGIHLYATDLEVNYKGFCPGKVEEEGSTTVPAHQLATLVRDMLGGDLELQQDKKKKTQKLHLRTIGKASDYMLHGLPPDHFPPVQDPGEEAEWVTLENGAGLKRMIKRVIGSCCVDDLQYHLASVLWEVIKDDADQESLRLVATDGHRLTVSEEPLNISGLAIGEGILVPGKGMRELLRFLDDQEPVHLAVHERLLFIKTGKKQLSIRLLDKRFPEYRRIIPAHFTHTFTFSREEMFKTLKRVSLVVSDRFKGVVFTAGEETVTLESNHPDVGEGLEVLPWTMAKGDPPELQAAEGEESGEETAGEHEPPKDLHKFGFNVRYLLEPLSLITQDQVELKGNDPDRPFLVRGVGHTAFFSIVMPMGR